MVSPAEAIEHAQLGLEHTTGGRLHQPVITRHRSFFYKTPTCLRGNKRFYTEQESFHAY